MAGFRRFSNTGYRGTSTKDIAREAGVNEVSIFRLYNDKLTLFDAVCEFGAKNKAPNIDLVESMLKTSRPLRQMAMEVGKYFYKTLTPEIQRLVQTCFMERPAGGPPLPPAMLEWPTHLTEASVEWVKREQKAGTIRKLRPETAAWALFFLLYYHFMNNVAYTEVDNEMATAFLETDVPELVDIWVRGVERQSK